MRVKEHPGAFHFALDVGRPYRAVADDARSAGPPMGPGDTLGDGGQAALRQACLYLPPQCIVGGAGPSPLDGRPVLRTYDVSIKHPGALATHAGSSVACILNWEDQAKCHRVVALRRASETRSRPVHCAPPARPFLAGPWSRPSTLGGGPAASNHYGITKLTTPRSRHLRPPRCSGSGRRAWWGG
jgi:hypothetical protein